MAAVPPLRFTCYTAQKVVVFDEDREEVLKEQRSKLEGYLRNHESDGENVILSGGCISASIGVLGHGCGFVAAFIGSLENYGYLVKQYPPENKENKGHTSKQQKCAEMVCQLYKIYGRVLQQKLRGDYSFVLYDSAQGRILAVASHQSTTPLLQARGPDGCLIVTSEGSECLPDGCALPTSIPPGHVKYGWSSDPQTFTDPRITAELKAAKIGRSPSRRISIKTVDDVPVVVERSSLSFADSETMSEEGRSEAGTEPQSPVIKKTRRGKRAGKNQKLRAELMARLGPDAGRGSGSFEMRHSFDPRNSLEFSRPSFEMSRNSMEFPPSPSMASTASFPGKADGRNWWRTDTPRSSFEVRSLPNAGFHQRPSFSRSSMSATASPFVPSSSLEPVHIVRPHMSNPFGLGRAQSRTLSQEVNVSRVILKTSMSGSLGAALSPFDTPQSSAVPTQPGKADAAWHEGDEEQQSTPFQDHAQISLTPARPQVAQKPKKSPQEDLDTPYTQAGPSSAVPEAKSSKQAALLSQLLGHDVTTREASDVAKKDDSAEHGGKPHMTALREDSAHEELSSASDSNKEGSQRGTAAVSRIIAAKGHAGKSSRRPSRAASESEPSDWETPAGASPLRGSSPPRPPKPPGNAKFKRMLRSLMQRRPSHPDLQSAKSLANPSSVDGVKEDGKSQAWARSSSHSALVDLEGPTGLWDARRSQPASSTHGSTASLASQKSSEKSKSKSPHSSQSNLQAWFARQASSLFDKSKSMNDLKDLDVPIQTPIK